MTNESQLAWESQINRKICENAISKSSIKKRGCTHDN